MEQNVWIEARLSKNGDPGEKIGSGRYIVNKNNIRTNKNIIMNEIKVDDYIIHIRMEGRLKEIYIIYFLFLIHIVGTLLNN